MNPIDPTAAAVLVVHLQNDIADPAGAFGGFFEAEATRNETLAKTTSLLEAAREASVFVSYARIGFEPGYADLVDNVPLLAMVRQFGAAVTGTWQTEIVSAVEPAEGDLVLTHTRTSPFQDTPLDRIYRARGISTVIVAGIATNASVEDAARHAANLGYRAIIASDASSAATREAHDASLASFGLFGESAANADLIDALTSESPSA